MRTWVTIPSSYLGRYFDLLSDPEFSYHMCEGFGMELLPEVRHGKGRFFGLLSSKYVKVLVDGDNWAMLKYWLGLPKSFVIRGRKG